MGSFADTSRATRLLALPCFVLIQERILSNLSGFDLASCKRVCMQWEKTVNKILESRPQFCWHTLGKSELNGAHTEAIWARLLQFLRNMPIVTGHLLIYVSRRLLKVMREHRGRIVYGRDLTKELKRHLPPDCVITGAFVSDNIIGTTKDLGQTRCYDEWDVCVSVLAIRQQSDLTVLPVALIPVEEGYNLLDYRDLPHPGPDAPHLPHLSEMHVDHMGPVICLASVFHAYMAYIRIDNHSDQPLALFTPSLYRNESPKIINSAFARRPHEPTTVQGLQLYGQHVQTLVFPVENIKTCEQLKQLEDSYRNISQKWRPGFGRNSFALQFLAYSLPDRRSKSRKLMDFILKKNSAALRRHFPHTPVVGVAANMYFENRPDWFYTFLQTAKMCGLTIYRAWEEFGMRANWQANPRPRPTDDSDNKDHQPDLAVEPNDAEDELLLQHLDYVINVRERRERDGENNPARIEEQPHPEVHAGQPSEEEDENEVAAVRTSEVGSGNNLFAARANEEVDEHDAIAARTIAFGCRDAGRNDAHPEDRGGCSEPDDGRDLNGEQHPEKDRANYHSQLLMLNQLIYSCDVNEEEETALWQFLHTGNGDVGEMVTRLKALCVRNDVEQVEPEKVCRMRGHEHKNCRNAAGMQTYNCKTAGNVDCDNGGHMHKWAKKSSRRQPQRKLSSIGSDSDYAYSHSCASSGLDGAESYNSNDSDKDETAHIYKPWKEHRDSCSNGNDHEHDTFHDLTQGEAMPFYKTYKGSVGSSSVSNEYDHKHDTFHSLNFGELGQLHNVQANDIDESVARARAARLLHYLRNFQRGVSNSESDADHQDGVSSLAACMQSAEGFEDCVNAVAAREDVFHEQQVGESVLSDYYQPLLSKKEMNDLRRAERLRRQKDSSQQGKEEDSDPHRPGAPTRLVLTEAARQLVGVARKQAMPGCPFPCCDYMKYYNIVKTAEPAQSVEFSSATSEAEIIDSASESRSEACSEQSSGGAVAVPAREQRESPKICPEAEKVVFEEVSEQREEKQASEADDRLYSEILYVQNCDVSQQSTGADDCLRSEKSDVQNCKTNYLSHSQNTSQNRTVQDEQSVSGVASTNSVHSEKDIDLMDTSARDHNYCVNVLQGAAAHGDQQDQNPIDTTSLSPTVSQCPAVLGERREHVDEKAQAGVDVATSSVYSTSGCMHNAYATPAPPDARNKQKHSNQTDVAHDFPDPHENRSLNNEILNITGIVHSNGTTGLSKPQQAQPSGLATPAGAGHFAVQLSVVMPRFAEEDDSDDDASDYGTDEEMDVGYGDYEECIFDQIIVFVNIPER